MIFDSTDELRRALIRTRSDVSATLTAEGNRETFVLLYHDEGRGGTEPEEDIGCVFLTVEDELTVFDTWDDFAAAPSFAGRTISEILPKLDVDL